jgi:phosphatidylglycerol:prolipoprotein diacylglycerol transferase
MSSWQLIYQKFSPVAFHIFSFPVHWYGLAYISALIVAFSMAKYFIKKDKYPFSDKDLDDLFIWEVLGVIIFSRIVYILVYDPNTSYYMMHPWQMFNPYINGVFTGIRGMSFHGGVIGFFIGTFMYTKIYKKSFWKLMDLASLSIPLGYVFGRIGNFLNQELIGRATDMPWGIYVHGMLRHPSQLYEAFLEGVVVFVILYFIRKYKKFDGFLIIVYFCLYNITRFIAEFYRAPDIQMGFYFDIFTMGQILSVIGMLISIILYFYLKNKSEIKQ